MYSFLKLCAFMAALFMFAYIFNGFIYLISKFIFYIKNGKEYKYHRNLMIPVFSNEKDQFQYEIILFIVISIGIVSLCQTLHIV